MGLNKGSNAVYLSVSNGQLIRQHKEPTADTKPRVNKVGRTVHEESFKEVTGFITGIATRDSEWGKQFTIFLEDDNEKFQIQMPYSGRYTSSFLKALPNVELDNEVRIMPWEMQDKNNATKKVSGITLYQGADLKEKILPAYTKEDPNGLPEMKQVKVKGKVTWDDYDMMQFLEKEAASLFASRNTMPATTTNEDDGLPF